MNQTKQHREWEKENTLTSPEDRNREEKFRLEQGAPPLTEKEVESALKDLNDDGLFRNYPKVERRFLDPPLENQKIFLISFVPAKGATPNENGIYGFAKMRGSFGSDTEANEQAEKIIRTTDSYHKIFHGYVGRPFPLTISSDYSKDINKVELKKAITESINEDVKKKREIEQKEIQEIKEREQSLLEDVKKKPEDNMEDLYTTMRVKDAQLRWTFLETQKKLKQMAGLIAKNKKEIEEADEKDPSLKSGYYEKYMNARRQAGLTTNSDDADSSFMKYLVQDVTIPEVDEEYKRLYGTSA